MAKFCPNCGTQLEDSCLFCATCGSKVEVQPQPQPTYVPPVEPQPTYTQPQPNYNQFNNAAYQAPAAAPNPKKQKTKKLLIIGGSILAAVLAIVIALILIFPGPKAVVNKMTKAIEQGNLEKAVNCMPSFLWDNDDDTKEDMIDYIEEMWEDEEIEDYDISCKIKEVSKLSRSEREDLQDFLEMLEDEVDFDADDINVKKAKKVEVKVTIKDGSYTERETIEVFVIKYKGQWKVLIPQLFYMF